MSYNRMSSSPEILREGEYSFLYPNSASGTSCLSIGDPGSPPLLDSSSILKTGNPMNNFYVSSTPEISDFSAVASPGKTPFPGRSNKCGYVVPPPVPFNSPEELVYEETSGMENILIAEAAKQENAIKLRLAQMENEELTPNNVVIASGINNNSNNNENNFYQYIPINSNPILFTDTPKRGSSANRGGIPKRLNFSLPVPQKLPPMEKVSVENLDLKSAANRILGSKDTNFTLIHNETSNVTETVTTDQMATSSMNNNGIQISRPYNTSDKETIRKAQMSSALELLRQIVPGLNENSDKGEILEESAKYLLFIKKKVGDQFDREFLLEFLSF